MRTFASTTLRIHFMRSVDVEAIITADPWAVYVGMEQNEPGDNLINKRREQSTAKLKS
jgi:hypothetical protein